MNIPGDVLCGELLIRMFGNQEIIIENHKGIHVYTSEEIIITCKLCLVFNFKDIVSSFKNKKEAFLELIEGLYNYYRKFERYSYVIVNKDSIEMAKSYLRQDQNFNNLILDTYRKISENIKEEHYNVYRQLNAGSNAGFI